MAKSKLQEKKTQNSLGDFKFSKENYTLLFIGLAINIIGFILMIGGGSDDPNVFHEDKLFSFQRLTLSPFLVVLGYIVMGYAIMKNPFKGKKEVIEKEEEE